MEPPVHCIGDLFRQLGLADRPAEIAAFLTRHRPLPAKMALAEAPFWSPVVSELDASLRDVRSDRQRPQERTAPQQV